MKHSHDEMQKLHGLELKVAAYENQIESMNRIHDVGVKIIEGKNAEIAELKEHEAALVDFLRGRIRKLQANPKESQEPEATVEELDPHHPLE